MAVVHLPPLAHRAPRALPAWVPEAALALLAAGLAVLTLGEGWRTHSEVGGTTDLVLGGVALLALAVRRRWPAAVAVLALLASTVSATAVGPALVATFGAAVGAPRRQVVVVGVVGVVASAVNPLVNATEDPYLADAASNTLLVAVLIGWGSFIRARRELVASLRERAERLQQEQRGQVEEARRAERRRIAREMHDVLAHRVSLLSLQAGALEFRPDAPPERLAAAAGGVRANAQAVLEELREVIGVLREDVDEGVAAPPQPDLDRLEALLEESRAAGMRVHARLALPAGTRPPTLVGRTAYRVVQEGLTNARKHAAGAGVEVEVAGGPGHGVAVSVVSRPAVRPAPTADGSGLGLVGLRERVALAGGELSHGREESGDFALRAALPWPA